MTVLIGMIGIDDSDIVLFSDGYAHNDGPALKNAIKTMRLNAECAVGIAGNSRYGNQVLANLAGRNEFLKEGIDIGHIDFVREAGAENLDLPDMTYEATKLMIDEIARHLLEKVPQVKDDRTGYTVILGGVSQERPKMCMWDSPDYVAHEWDFTSRGSQILFCLPGELPGGNTKAQVAHILTCTPDPLKKRIKRVIKLFAQQYPQEVNRFITFRMLSDGFLLRHIASSRDKQ